MANTEVCNTGNKKKAVRQGCVLEGWRWVWGVAEGGAGDSEAEKVHVCIYDLVVTRRKNEGFGV